MNKPKMTEAELLASHSQIINTVPELVKIIGMRGYYKNTMGKEGENDRGIYDDAIFVIAPGVYQSFNGNTDPSVFKPGIAKLIPGVHYYKKGKHGISKPGGGYPAFRPDTSDESLPVTRDGKTGIHKGIAINIHKGGYTKTSSEGCQTIYPYQWEEFRKLVYGLMDKYGQSKVPYILIEA